MKTRHLFLTAILAFLALSAVQADTPELINYQGRLTNPDGSPQAGTKTFSLSIWDDATGGAALYSEDLGEILLDENGIYSFQFGADSAALAQALQAGGQHWIELTVDNAVLSPRQRILAVPFALKAARADTATRAGSVGDDDGNVDITGNLDIAKNTTLQRDLNVEGNASFRGIVDAEQIFLQGGAIRLDGGINRISGLLTEIRSDLLVERNAIFENDAIFLGDVRFENPLIRFLGGDITFDNNRTTFNGEVRLNGPVTSDGQVNISGALNAGRLEIDGPFGGTRLDGVINRLSGEINEINAFETMFEGDRVRFRNFETRFDSEFNVFRGNETRFENNRTTFDGEVRLNGPVTSDGQVNISGALNAGRLEIDGPFGGTRLDGVINRLSGEINEINAFETMFEGDRVRFRNFETRFDSEFNVFRGNETRFENNRTTFDGEVRLNGPITDSSHAVNKAYVDALGDTLEAKEAARVVALTNIDLVAPSPEIDGVTLAEGDRVLLAGQTNSAENGVYLSGADGTLTRAGDFNAIEKIGGGSHLFIQEGSQAGQGYVLADLGEAFELGTSALAFSRFTVDPTQSLDLGNDLAVAGNADVAGALNAGRLEIDGPFAPTRLDGEFNILGGIDTRFEGDRVTFRNFETRFENPETRFEGNNVEFRNNRTTFDGEVRLNGPVTSDGQVNISGALNAGRLEVFGPGGITRIDGIANIIYGDLETRFDGDRVTFRNFETRFENPETRFEGNNVEFRNNRTTFDGEVRLNGPVTSDGQVNISGALNAGRLEVFGPGGITRIDGIANIIYGDLETRVEGGPLLVQGAVEALSFNNVSDRNLKENFEAVDGTEVLEKVTNLPVSTWNFIADEDSARHLGPTAQDFHAAFGLGEHETHISTVDASGVAIAAIQGLDSKVDATRAELLQSNAALLEMVQALQERLETLEANQ